MALVLIASASFGKVGVKIVRFGLKAGYTAENDNVKTSNITVNTGQKYNLAADPNFGFHLGMMARVDLKVMHIHTELTYNLSKYSLAIVPAGGQLSTDKIRVSTLTMPILAGKKFAFIRLEAGPVFNLMTSTSNSNSSSQNVTAVVTKPAVGYMIGVGADIIKKITFDIRYSGQFKKPTQNLQIGDAIGQDVKMGMDQWLFSVGYLF